MSERTPDPAGEAGANSASSASIDRPAPLAADGAGESEPSYAGPDPAAHSAPPVWATEPEQGAFAARAAAVSKLAGERPELVIAAAFVGGLLIATILKRLAR